MTLETYSGKRDGRRASYRFGVAWIAANDEPCDLSHASIAGYISTLLLADLFGKDPDIVAHDILRTRQAAAGS